jgi:hypothetical protein
MYFFGSSICISFDTLSNEGGGVVEGVCGQETVVVHVGQGVIVVVVVAAIIALRTLTFGFVPRGQLQQNFKGSFFANIFMLI